MLMRCFVIPIASIVGTILVGTARGSLGQQPPLAYVGPAAGPGAVPGASSLWLVNPDATNAVSVPLQLPTGLVYLENPKWSRDAALIVAEGAPPSGAGISPFPQIFTFDRSGGNLQQQTNIDPRSYDPSASVVETFAAFSPDKQSVAVSAVLFPCSVLLSPSCVYNLVTTDVLVWLYPTNGSQVPSATIGATGFSPSSGSPYDWTGWGIDWSPTAGMVATPAGTPNVTPSLQPIYCPSGLFVPTITEIWEAPAQNNPNPFNPPPGAVRVTNSFDAACALAAGLKRLTNVLPVFSPDGARIAFVRWIQALDGSTNTSIRVITLGAAGDGTEVVLLPNVQTFGLSWSGDGTQLAFDQVPVVGGIPQPQSATVWTIDAMNGTGLSQVAQAPAGEPAWSPQFPVPTLVGVSPAHAVAGSGPFTLTVTGANFASASVVRWNGAGRQTTFVSTTELHASISAADLAQAGTAQVAVFNPAPGGGTSTAHPFTITAAASPAVALSTKTVTFAPQLVGATGTPQSITVTNSGAATLSISAVAVTKNGGDIGSFAEADHCVGSVAAGASCTITVTFKATGVGAASGTLSITDNATDTPQTVALSGTGADLSFVPAPGGSTTDTVRAGQTAMYHLVAQPSGYSGTVSLACSGAPPAASCSPSPTSLAVSATASAPFTIAVVTAAPSQAMARTTRGLPVPTPPTARLGPWLVALALLAMLLARKNGLTWGRAGLPAAVILALAAACGSGNAVTGPTQRSGGTPAGSYTLVVTGASGDVTRTINLTLDVK